MHANSRFVVEELWREEGAAVIRAEKLFSGFALIECLPWPSDLRLVLL